MKLSFHAGGARGFCVALALLAAPAAAAQSQRPLTLPQALQRALAANPRLTEADREVGMAAGRRVQAGAIPNPEISFELNNAFGTGDLRGLTSAESTLQLS
jgi:cobalt-zinc-cadmium efflux system outer membrane protein